MHLKRHHIQPNIIHRGNEIAIDQNQFHAQLLQIISSRQQLQMQFSGQLGSYGIPISLNNKHFVIYYIANRIHTMPSKLTKGKNVV